MVERIQTYSFRWTPLKLIVLLFILQVLISLLTQSMAFSFDEAMWNYIGHNWLRRGLIPYSGGVDNKSPLIFFIFGASDFLFGLNYWFPRILGAITEAAGIYFLYKIAFHIGGRQTGFLAITLYGLSLLWRSTGGIQVSLTETYENTFVIISFYYCLTSKQFRNYFIAGIFAGVAFLFRFSAAFSIIAILIICFRNSAKYGFSFLAGSVAIVLILGSLFVFSGIDVYDFLNSAFVDNFGAGSITNQSVLFRLESFANSFFYSELVLFYPALVSYFFIKNRFFFLTAWLICTFIGINLLGTYARPHFKDLLPPLSLMSAVSINYLIENYRVPVKLIMVIIWIVFFPKLIEPFIGLKRLIAHTRVNSNNYCTNTYAVPDDYSKKKLGQWIRSSTKENEKVLVAGYGAIVQAYSERLSPTIYFNATQTAKAKSRFFKDICMDMPNLILIPSNNDYRKNVDIDIRTFIDKLVGKNYNNDSCLYGYEIYRRINEPL